MYEVKPTSRFKRDLKYIERRGEILSFLHRDVQGSKKLDRRRSDKPFQTIWCFRLCAFLL